MLQFVRFVKLSEDMYAADIEPEFDVLKLIGDHFHDRFPLSRFIIRDLRHLRAIVSAPSGWQITSLPAENPPLPRDGEFENLWRMYFKTIANETRKNLSLQQHFVPLKYRRHLTEFDENAVKE
jgi:probable DNA metabolism protein